MARPEGFEPPTLGSEVSKSRCFLQPVETTRNRANDRNPLAHFDFRAHPQHGTFRIVSGSLAFHGSYVVAKKACVHSPIFDTRVLCEPISLQRSSKAAGLQRRGKSPTGTLG